MSEFLMKDIMAIMISPRRPQLPMESGCIAGLVQQDSIVLISMVGSYGRGISGKRLLGQVLARVVHR